MDVFKTEHVLIVVLEFGDKVVEWWDEVLLSDEIPDFNITFDLVEDCLTLGYVVLEF